MRSCFLGLGTVWPSSVVWSCRGHRWLRLVFVLTSLLAVLAPHNSLELVQRVFSTRPPDWLARSTSLAPNLTWRLPDQETAL